MNDGIMYSLVWLGNGDGVLCAGIDAVMLRACGGVWGQL